ncbi:glycoside hydrolase family 3 protein [Solirubrobacter soli]|uniref:glycoside hydrolase family 3 protein n=1 Tax=Solirubrobacter soli TaxID=363832 RepID=UPI0004055974|nr:glycoside hydrolase family 3 protein [Solirubrobacter soli]
MHRSGSVLLAAGAAVAAMAVPAAGAHQASQQAAALPYENAGLPVQRRVDDLLSRMTPAEKIGQMTQAERSSVDADTSKITTDALGSVLSGGGSVPTPNTPTAWADMVDRYQRAALATRLHIPLIYGVDTVHGHGNLNGATVFPHNIGLGATRDPALVRDVEHVAAEETRASGPQWAFAPCICVARDDRWGRTYESFGEDPSLVIQMETAIEGFQGPPGHLSDPDRVLATAKHFAGDGLTTYGTGSNSQTTGNYPIDQGVDQVDHATFDRLALQQYVPAVQRYDVGSVMPSYSDVDWTEDGLGNPINMHGNRDLITGWLKQKVGFDGFVISDYNGIDHIDPTTSTFAQKVQTGVNAGIDMFMQPSNFEQFETTLNGLVTSGQVPMARIDDAVRRILTKKFELGLFEHPFTDRRNIGQVGSPAHRALARRAVAESQVLLKNDKHVLPLRGNHDVYVAGSNANVIGNQAGGWTLTWQGGSTNVIPGTTILDGIRQEARGNVTFSVDGSAPISRKAFGVVVVGETPYAEGFGDVFGPQWAYDPGDNGQPRPVKDMQLSAADKAAVDKVCAAAKRCVIVVVSGRPLILDPAQRNAADAIVAAWLPGSEGEGVADTLFGARPYTGKLPVTWPKTLAQEPINIGDRHYDPLYPFGYGLRTGF